MARDRRRKLFKSQHQITPTFSLLLCLANFRHSYISGCHSKQCEDTTLHGILNLETHPSTTATFNCIFFMPDTHLTIPRNPGMCHHDPILYKRKQKRRGYPMCPAGRDRRWRVSRPRLPSYQVGALRSTCHLQT